MAYGEGLQVLNPCDAEAVAALLTPILKPGERLIDIGCGRGETLSWLAAHGQYVLFGVEPDPALFDAAQRACPAAAIANAGAQALPYGDGVFDAALMECVFSLLDRQKAVAEELARVVRSGGIVLLSDLFARDAAADKDEPTSPDAQMAQDTDIGQGALAASDTLAAPDALVRCIFTKRQIEGFFQEAGFALAAFHDRTKDLQAMFAQMILDGADACCLDEETLARLRRAKAGYGIWIWNKA